MESEYKLQPSNRPDAAVLTIEAPAGAELLLYDLVDALSAQQEAA
jgi:hypothetical protein